MSLLEAIVAPKIELLKAIGLDELILVAQKEVLLKRRLLAAHERAGKRSVFLFHERSAFLVHEKIVNGATKRSVSSALTAAGKGYSAILSRETRKALTAHIGPVYDSMYAVAARKAAGKIDDDLDYDVARASVTKADEVRRDEKDDENVERLLLLLLLGTSTFWKRRILPRVHARIDIEVWNEGLKGVEASSAIEAIVREEVGTAPIGPKERLPEGAANAEVSSAFATTLTRAMATLSVLDKAGIDSWVWRTAGDERVCPRCSAMDGRRFPVAESIILQQKIARAKTLSTLKTVAPWYSENRFAEIVDTADRSLDPSATLLEHGVTLPLHGACRCGVDFETGKG